MGEIYSGVKEYMCIPRASMYRICASPHMGVGNGPRALNIEI